MGKDMPSYLSFKILLAIVILGLIALVIYAVIRMSKRRFSGSLRLDDCRQKCEDAAQACEKKYNCDTNMSSRECQDCEVVAEDCYLNKCF
jgi:hypothetical protein